ncbi:MAG: hypothetical protein IKK37_00285 [Clostridia bacterium]|nr:hypothetical protein [Clostridia bacterium]
MKKLGIVIVLVIALSCFAIAAFAVDMPSHIASVSTAVSFATVSNLSSSAFAGAAVVVLGLSAASVVVLRRK